MICSLHPGLNCGGTVKLAAESRCLGCPHLHLHFHKNSPSNLMMVDDLPEEVLVHLASIKSEPADKWDRRGLPRTIQGISEALGDVTRQYLTRTIFLMDKDGLVTRGGKLSAMGKHGRHLTWWKLTDKGAARARKLMEGER